MKRSGDLIYAGKDILISIHKIKKPVTERTKIALKEDFIKIDSPKCPYCHFSAFVCNPSSIEAIHLNKFRIGFLKTFSK